MFARQKIWKPLLVANPAFLGFTKLYEGKDPITTATAKRLDTDPSKMFVALNQDRHGKDVAYMLGIVAKIRPEACDDIVGDKSNRRRMSVGYATAVSDTLNTLHIMGRLLPKKNAHVSVNMQSQICGKSDLIEGTEIVIVSTIEKMGKQIVYCTTDFYHNPAVVPAEVAAQEAKIANTNDLRIALHNYEKIFHNSHVKAIVQQDLV